MESPSTGASQGTGLVARSRTKRSCPRWRWTDQPPVFRTEVMCQNVPSLGELVSPLAGSSCADPAQTIRGAERLH